MTTVNCSTCTHKHRNITGGHCYMFQDAPNGDCKQHTGYHQQDLVIPGGNKQMLTKVIGAILNTTAKK